MINALPTVNATTPATTPTFSQQRIALLRTQGTVLLQSVLQLA